MRVLAFISAFFLAQTAYAADFRGNNWGDSPEEVIAVEGEPVSRTTNGYALILYYKKSLDGKEVDVGYYFAPEGKLAIGSYIDRKAEGLSSFFTWVEEITASYGEPEKRDFGPDDQRTLDEFYARGPDRLAEAVKQGVLVLHYRWQTETTVIHVGALGSAGSMDISLSYASPSYVREFLKSIEEYPMKRVP